jgi:hypothetical protein
MTIGEPEANLKPGISENRKETTKPPMLLINKQLNQNTALKTVKTRQKDSNDLKKMR